MDNFGGVWQWATQKQEAYRENSERLVLRERILQIRGNEYRCHHPFDKIHARKT
jgi:hypothetical protein